MTRCVVCGGPIAEQSVGNDYTTGNPIMRWRRTDQLMVGCPGTGVPTYCRPAAVPLMLGAFYQPTPVAKRLPPTMTSVYLRAQFDELHEWARDLRGQRRIDQTLDYFYAGQLSLYAAVHNLAMIRRRVDYWENV